MSRNARTVSTALLVPQDRVARVPVAVWTARLHRRLHDVRAAERRRSPFAEAVGTVSNQASLVAAFQGATDTAEALCRGQLVWQDRMSRRGRAPELALLGVQPWVNLGRLEALSGAWESALDRFARLVQPGADGRLCLGSARIGTGVRGGADGGGYGSFLRNVYVVDSLKALLANRRWDDVLAFAGRLPRGDPTAVRADEARVVAFCRLGDPERGASTALARRRASAGWVRVVFALRYAEALACAGRCGEAARELAQLAVTLRALSLDARRRLDNLYVLVAVAQACAEVGVGDDARALAAGAAEAATAAEDEVLLMESLRILRKMAGSNAAPAEDVLSGLESTTGYARYRSGCRPPLQDDGADRLYRELRELFIS